MSDSIFISYRRADTNSAAHAVYREASKEFGSHRVFIDVDTIVKGANFISSLNHHIRKCRVMIVMIGEKWLSSSDEVGRKRLDLPNDFVRLEISTALQRGIAILPVLVDGAQMPDEKVLPHDLRSLSTWQAAQMSTHDLELNVAGIIRSLKLHVGEEIVDKRTLSPAPLAAIVTAMAALVSGTLLAAFAVVIGLIALSTSVEVGRNFSSSRGNPLFMMREMRELADLGSLALLAMAILGIIIFATTYLLERRFRNLGKLLLTVLSVSALLCVSLINFSTAEVIMSANAQFIANALLIAGSIYLCIRLASIDARSTPLVIAKYLLMICLVLFGIGVPTAFSTMFAAYKLGMTTSIRLGPGDILLAVSSMIGLLLAFAWKERRSRR